METKFNMCTEPMKRMASKIITQGGFASQPKIVKYSLAGVTSEMHM